MLSSREKAPNADPDQSQNHVAMFSVLYHTLIGLIPLQRTSFGLSKSYMNSTLFERSSIAAR